MSLKEIFLKAKCCISERPLADCQSVNVIQTDYVATWKYPSMGNILIPGDYNHATAFIHDDYAPKKAGDKIADIKFVVEFKNDTVIYHPVESLSKGPLMLLQDAGLHLTDQEKAAIQEEFFDTKELDYWSPDLLQETLEMGDLQFAEGIKPTTSIVIWTTTEDQQKLAIYLAGKIMNKRYAATKNR